MDNGLPRGNPDVVNCIILKGPAHDFFEVDPLCTYLNVIQKIDVNTYPEFMTLNVALRAYDKAAEVNATALVRINVYDINDHSPVFSPNSYEGIIEGKSGNKLSCREKRRD